MKSVSREQLIEAALDRGAAAMRGAADEIATWTHPEAGDVADVLRTAASVWESPRVRAAARLMSRLSTAAR